MKKKAKIDFKLRLAIHKQKVAQYYNRRVKGRQFQIGDLVFKRAEAASYIP